MFFAFIWTSVGGAFFKPIMSAMIARTTTNETSSSGFCIFYMMINIGGFIGPFIAGVLMQKSWDYVFNMSIITIGVNYIITWFFFHEPVVKDKSSSLRKNILQAFVNIKITLKNWKYLLLLIIMILFWTAFNQLYYSSPIFVDQWVDTIVLYDGIKSIWPWLAETIGIEDGTMIAPADQKALYMGTSFLPIAVAHQLADWLSGDVYEKIADKIYLLQQEVTKQGISIPEILGDFTKNDYVKMAS